MPTEDEVIGDTAIVVVSCSGFSVLNGKKVVIVPGSCVDTSDDGNPEPSSGVDSKSELSSGLSVIIVTISFSGGKTVGFSVLNSEEGVPVRGPAVLIVSYNEVSFSMESVFVSLVVGDVVTSNG